MDATVFTSAEVPDGLVDLLSAHLPYSLPLLRRLQFTKCKGGLTPTSRVLFSSENGKAPQYAAAYHPRHFTAAYVDPAAGPETQMWIYSTLENGEIPPGEEKMSSLLIVSVANETRKICKAHDGELAYPGGILVGSLHLSVREAMTRGDIPFSMRSPLGYDKWLFNVGEIQSTELGLSDGMYWAPASRHDCFVAISRNDLPRQVYRLPPSNIVKLRH